MTIKLAITGKGGSGKTTIVKAFMQIFKEMFPEKSILLFDNDLASELGHSFGLDIRNTIYGIRSGKHEYKTGIPEDMSKQEYIEWAMEDILVSIDDNVDIIVSWFVGSKDCRCPVTKLINDAVLKLINRYDLVIFDCEFDLKYLNILVDVYKSRMLQDMDTRAFKGGNAKQKFEAVGEKELYLIYDYDSAFEHGLWSAIRESSLLACDAPGHQFHCVPDVENRQKMKSVWHDVVVVMNKTIKLLVDEFGISDELKKRMPEYGL